MIKKFIDKLLAKATTGARRAPPPRFGKREEVPAAVHGIDPERVDRWAREVVQTLQQAGFEAYIVGGAVRDLLLGLRPKDFDVATNPDERLRTRAGERGWRVLDLFPLQAAVPDPVPGDDNPSAQAADSAASVAART